MTSGGNPCSLRTTVLFKDLDSQMDSGMGKQHNGKVFLVLANMGSEAAANPQGNRDDL